MMPPAGARDVVAGTLITFNDNGAWTWYSDERAVVDAAGNKLIVGSDANAMGPGGSSRNGNAEAVIYDLNTGAVGQPFNLGKLGPDDHNTAAFLVRPNGGYLAFWAGHNEDCRSYWRIYSGTSWGASQSFDWVPRGCSTTADRKVTYNNLWYMSAENRIYNFVRSIETSPNLLVSSDNGMTWTYGGRLTSTPTVGYVAGYYKYWGNGVDRIDFFGTEAHPRDFDNSLYHGYLQGGRSYTSTGTMVDASISDGMSPQITAFTKVFTTGMTINGARLHHAWNMDLMRYPDGTVAAIWKARADTNADNPDHRLMYARLEPGSSMWQLTYLGKAGPKLYADEQDYIGLGSIHPNDPRTIFISTTIDPRNDTTNLGVHEIFQGTTCDNGRTFTWTPITQQSMRSNIRPIVPSWDAQHTVLLWNRGTYETAQRYNMAVVGTVTTH
jgi:hypothetical protein